MRAARAVGGAGAEAHGRPFLGLPRTLCRVPVEEENLLER